MLVSALTFEDGGADEKVFTKTSTAETGPQMKGTGLY